MSHKNHDLHLDVRCCDLLSMENPRHSSHKSEPIAPWSPQLPQLTRQAIPPSPIPLQHPCPRSRQTIPIMGLRVLSSTTLALCRKGGGHTPSSSADERDKTCRKPSTNPALGVTTLDHYKAISSLTGMLICLQPNICCTTAAAARNPRCRLPARSPTLVLEETIPSIPVLASGISGFPDPQ